MTSADPDRNLLFGLLALQNGLIDQAKLVAAFQAWTLHKARPLAEHLVARGDLDADDRSAVEALVTRHLKKHGGSTEMSLAAIPAGPSTRRSLQRIADPEIDASLAVLGPETDAEGAPARIAERTVALSRVRLAATDPGPDPPVVRDGEGEIDGLAGRYQVLGELGRGGMGAVLRGRDLGLGRDLALKVLLEKHCERPDLVHRFVEEAQICGQLQHPGVVPVYELGTLADDRPFFTMKLVKGQTLAALLAERSSPAAERPRFLAVFEAVCQTVAYAHARGVIHRDLKPSNVMVGSFGEVQVMDWGLAKVLPRHGQKEPAREPVPNETVIATARSTGDSDASQTGSVLGTPAYMAPEQARGETESIDRRADVFALGSILCEILSGAPAFAGASAIEILGAAGRGDTAAALARLVKSETDAELLSLARDCLAAEAQDRPADAGVVAARITAYLAGVQERLRRAELARVAADARAQEERKRRLLAMALAAAVVALMAIGGTVAAVYIQQRRDLATRLDLALTDVYRLRDLAREDAAGDPAKWHAALAAVDRAVDVLGPLSDPTSRSRVLALRQEVGAAAEAADRDSTLLNNLNQIRECKANDAFGDIGDRTYAWVFHEAGLDIDELEPDAAAAQIRTRPAGVIPLIAAGLDDWAIRRRKARPKDIESSMRLIAVARAADPDGTRDRLRAVWLQPEGKARREPLLALAKEADLRLWPVQTLTLLATSLLDVDEPAAAAELLDRAQAHHPDDVWINYTLGRCLEELRPPRTDDAIRFYTAARALRPETAHDLAHALNRRGQVDEALAVFQNLTERSSQNGRHWACLATLRDAKGDRDGAKEAMQSAYSIFRGTLNRRPDDVATHVNLGGLLGSVAHNYAEAAAEYSAALKLDPENVKAHFGLGNALREQGKLDEAAASYRVAIRLKPDFGPAHHNLAYIMIQQGNVDTAIAEGRESLRLQPDAAAVPGNLAWLLALYPDRPARDYEEAATLVRKSLETQSKVPVVQHTLALVEYRRGHWDASISAAERAMALRKGGLPNDWFLLAMALARKGEKQKAVEWYEKAVEERRRLKMTVDDVFRLWSEAAQLLGLPAPPSQAYAVP